MDTVVTEDIFLWFYGYWRHFALIPWLLKTFCSDTMVTEDILLWYHGYWRHFALIPWLLKTFCSDTMVTEDILLWYHGYWRHFALIPWLLRDSIRCTILHNNDELPPEGSSQKGRIQTNFHIYCSSHLHKIWLFWHFSWLFIKIINTVIAWNRIWSIVGHFESRL